MRRRMWWLILLLLGMPHVAVADSSTRAADELLPGGALDLERTGTAVAAAPPTLDLRIGSTYLPEFGDVSASTPAIASEPAGRYTSADQHPSDRGLSFGFEIRPRSTVGNLARKDDIQDPTVTDQLQRVIERPAFGIRGRYRF